MGLAPTFCNSLPFLMMKVKIVACLMICCKWQLVVGDWIHNKLNGGGKMVVGTWWGLNKWWNGCWNVVGTCDLMKWLLVGSGHWGRWRFRLWFWTSKLEVALSYEASGSNHQGLYMYFNLLFWLNVATCIWCYNLHYTLRT